MKDHQETNSTLYLRLAMAVLVFHFEENCINLILDTLHYQNYSFFLLQPHSCQQKFRIVLLL